MLSAGPPWDGREPFVNDSRTLRVPLGAAGRGWTQTPVRSPCRGRTSARCSVKPPGRPGGRAVKPRCRSPEGATVAEGSGGQFSISLDGYAAGPDQAPDRPMGAGGEKLHEWAFATRTFRQMFGSAGGDPGSDEGIDDRFAAQADVGIGATIMGRDDHGTQHVRADPGALAGRGVEGMVGRPNRPTTTRSSCSPTTRGRHSPCEAARPSTSSPIPIRTGCWVGLLTLPAVGT